MNLFPVSAVERERIKTPRIDTLTDNELDRLNKLLPWQCFTLDAHGRRFGCAASLTKRNTPQEIPDRRITELNGRIPLAGLEVLEVGCFEGIHTVSLAGYGAKVTGVDSRIENVAKTMLRAWGFGLEATILRCDVERDDEFATLPKVDVVVHIGVLYHLVDPITHLRKMLARTRKAIVLDTHYAQPNEASKSYSVDGVVYCYKHYKEGGRQEAFAGMYDHAKWLPLDTITEILRACGFHTIDVAELRDERNGPRMLLYASRSAASA